MMMKHNFMTILIYLQSFRFKLSVVVDEKSSSRLLLALPPPRTRQSGSAEEDRPHDHLTALAAVWGEFVADDISYTLPLSGYEQCCDSMFRKENPMECHPITAHTATATFCQEYVRSAIGLKPGCALGPREQGRQH